MRASPRTASLAKALASHAALVAALAVVAAVHVPMLHDYFHGDDFIAFIDLASKDAWTYLQDVVTFQDSNIYWRPLGEVYHLAMYSAFGLSPVAFHGGSLAFFLITLALVYVFCLNFGLNRAVGVGAVLLIGLFPNHAVNVAWTTAVPRIIGVMFLMATLVLLQTAVRRRGAGWDVLAVVAFALACLSDETLALLAPVPVLLALAIDRGKGWQVRTALRTIAFGAIGGAVVALQLLVEPAQAPGEIEYGLGTHIFRNYWGLASKLVLPVKDGVTLAEITAAQWAAGAVAAVAGAWLLLIGSTRVRFLVLWTALGLAPFTLWIVPITPSRYGYMAALPFAILASWLVVRGCEVVLRLRLWQKVPAGRIAAYASLVPVVLAAAALLVTSGRETQARNAAFAAETEPYRVLATRLPDALRDVPPGATIVMYYGIWDDLVVWPTSVVRTIYKDPTLRFVNVPPERIGSAPPYTRHGDRIVFYTGEGFLTPQLPIATTTEGR